MNLTELLALCEKATPGPWRTNHDPRWMYATVEPNIAKLTVPDDAAYIAACTPERIAALVRCVMAADAIRKHMEKVSTCKCSSNQCGWCRKVNSFDAARAAMGE